ncbi:MAG: restriction endonuclease subunit S, partial [Thermomicrobiales bacterium]
AESGRLDASIIRPWSEVKKGYTKFEEGDIVFAKITPSMENGKAALASGLEGGRGVGSTEYHVFRPGPDLNARYLLHFLLQISTRRAARAQMRGVAGQLRVPATFFSELEIPLPPLHEQKLIVAEIETQFARLDAAVAALQSARIRLKRYRASVLKAACEGRLVPTEAELARREGREYEHASVLLERIQAERDAAPTKKRRKANDAVALDTSELPAGWAWTQIGLIASLVTSGSRGWSGFYSDMGADFVRAQDINRDNLDISTTAKVALPEKAERNRTRLHYLDILITITGANVTKSALVTSNPSEAYVSQHVGLVRLSVPEFAQFVYLWIVSPFQGRRLLEKEAYGAGKPGLGLEDLRSLQVPIPPLAEQERIVAEIERRMSVIKQMEALVETNLKRAETLRQSILRMAFNGRLSGQE